MALNPQEQEILNKLKVYARSYGLPVGLGVLLAVASIVGWNLYQGSRLANLEQATYTYQRFLQVSDAYNEAAAELEITLLNADNSPTAEAEDELLDNIAGTESFNASTEFEVSPAERVVYLRSNLAEIARVLREDHASTTYAGFAVLRLAAIDLMNNNLTDAIESATWVFQKSPSIETTRLAGLMLGRALMEENKYQQALSILNSNRMGGLESSSTSELLGDIYYRTQDHEKALAAYQQALALGANSAIINYKISLLSPQNPPLTN